MICANKPFQQSHRTVIHCQAFESDLRRQTDPETESTGAVHHQPPACSRKIQPISADPNAAREHQAGHLEPSSTYIFLQSCDSYIVKPRTHLQPLDIPSAGTHGKWTALKEPDLIDSLSLKQPGTLQTGNETGLRLDLRIRELYSPLLYYFTSLLHSRSASERRSSQHIHTHCIAPFAAEPRAFVYTRLAAETSIFSPRHEFTNLRYHKDKTTSSRLESGDFFEGTHIHLDTASYTA